MMSNTAARNANRSRLMARGSVMALALGLTVGHASAAHAQSIAPRENGTRAVQADATIVDGEVSISTSPTITNVDVFSELAIINWTTLDDLTLDDTNDYINFLPANTEMAFTGFGSGGNFAVLNRIISAPNSVGQFRGIAFSGTVSSFLDVSPNTPTGNIWFISQGGILATSTAVFNVGSLLLTTSEVTNFSAIATNFGLETSGTFSGVNDPFSSIIVASGASFNLPSENSSLIFFAPTIEMGGDAVVNGQVFYASGETGAAAMNDVFGAGVSVFDGAQPGNRIIHNGTTTGPVALSATDPMAFDVHSVNFLAPGTGTALEVLVSGTVGFDPAAAGAIEENGVIRLTGGAVTIDNAILTSRTEIQSDSANIVAGNGQSVVMGGDGFGDYDLTIRAQDVTFGALAGGVVDIAGTVTIDPSSPASATLDFFALGDPAGAVPAGSVDVGGDFLALLNEPSAFGTSTNQAGGGITGSITNGGRFAVGGSIALDVSARAGENSAGTTSAQGGSIAVSMSGTGSVLSAGGAISLNASAERYFETNQCSGPCGPIPGGDAFGGTITFTASEGTISADGLFADVSASAEDGRGTEAAGTTFDAAAGDALVELGNTDASFNSINVRAAASGGFGAENQDGGNAIGGTAILTKGLGGSLATGEITLSAAANGGGGGDDNMGFAAGNGGDATAGTATLALGNTPTGLQFFNFDVGADGGNGGSYFSSPGFTTAGNPGGVGGDATGGTGDITVAGANTVFAGVIEGGIEASATGGNGGTGEASFVEGGIGGAGGTGTGGSLTITAETGATFVQEFDLATGGTGGNGGIGGDNFDQLGGLSGGDGGSGGDGVGGSLALFADGGTISSIAGPLEFTSRGDGGNGGDGGFGDISGALGTSGDGFGGAVSVRTSDNGGPGIIDWGDIRIDTTGSDGFGANFGAQIAGQIEIIDELTDPAGVISATSLELVDFSFDPGAQPNVFISGNSGPITATDGFTVNVSGDVVVDMAGAGQIVSDGAVVFLTDGDVTITHLGNPGINTIAGSIFESSLGGSFTARPGSVISQPFGLHGRCRRRDRTCRRQSRRDSFP